MGPAPLRLWRKGGTHDTKKHISIQFLYNQIISEMLVNSRRDLAEYTSEQLGFFGYRDNFFIGHCALYR